MVVATLAISVTLALPSAQTPESPVFEGAVLRRAAGPVPGISPYGSGLWSANSINLSALLPYAFDLRLSVQPIIGLPEWNRAEWFSIAAKAEDGVILTRETLRPRLRRFIEERFKLVAHIETKNVKGYALVVAKGGSKLKITTQDLAMGAIGSGMVRSPSATMDRLASALEDLLNLETRRCACGQ